MPAKKVKNSANTERSVRGKKSRAAGARFELKVWKDLEEKGWTIARWTNNVELEEEKE